MNPQSTTFIFQGYDAAIDRGEVVFHYRVQMPEKEITFTEKISFTPVVDHAIPPELLESILNNLLLILGVSYWKLYCPQNIVIETFTLTKEQAGFWNTVYTKGLGDFFYQNNIDYRGIISFPYDNKHVENGFKPFLVPRQNRSLLFIGGGKDSLVSGELLKRSKKEFTAFVVNPKNIHKQTIQMLGSPTIAVKRSLDTKLLELNQQKQTYNGHVPATAIINFLGFFAAILYDYRYIIGSNEHSANYGNVQYHEEEINHQWSKSFEFEQLFQAYAAKYITPSITYFSLLRPFTEIKIAKLFAQYKYYFPVFSSCNRNFRVTGEKSNHLWCCECPKCAFVFTMLAVYVSKNEVVKIFGKDLFIDVNLLLLFKELLGLGKVKPFECVGTPEEMKYAMYLIYKKEEFVQTPVMKMFVAEAMITEKQAQMFEKELVRNHENVIPEEFIPVIYENK